MGKRCHSPLSCRGRTDDHRRIDQDDLDPPRRGQPLQLDEHGRAGGIHERHRGEIQLDPRRRRLGQEQVGDRSDQGPPCGVRELSRERQTRGRAVDPNGDVRFGSGCGTRRLLHGPTLPRTARLHAPRGGPTAVRRSVTLPGMNTAPGPPPVGRIPRRQLVLVSTAILVLTPAAVVLGTR